MIYPDLDPGLEIPGLPDDLRERLSACMQELFSFHQECHRDPALYAVKQAVNEPQYLQRLTETTDDEKRREIMNAQLCTRLSLVFAVLKLHQRYEIWHRRMEALTTEVGELRKLIADLPADHPLVGLTAGMAGIVSSYRLQDPEEALKELDDIKGLTADRALEALLTIFKDIKAGGADFLTGLRYRPFSFLGDCPLLEVRDLDGPIRELCEAIRDGGQAYRSFIEPKRQFHEAKANLNRPQYAARLEEALRGPVEGRRYTPFDEVKRQQLDAEASFFAAIEHLKLWHVRITAARSRVRTALDAALAALEPGGDIWSMKDFFADDQVNGYKSMINCIAAMSLIEQLDGLDDEFRKVEADFADTNLPDPVAYIDQALAAAGPSLS